MSTETTTTDTKTPLVESQTFYATTGTFQILCVKAELALRLQAELRTANTALREAEGKVAEMRAWFMSSIKYMWQNETREVAWDSTMVAGKGYDFFGWEDLRWELILPWAKFAVWPSEGKWSVYGGRDGGFNKDQTSQEEAMKLAESWALAEFEGSTTLGVGWRSPEEVKELEATITNLGSALDKLRLNHGEECRQMIETSKEHIENCAELACKNAELSREVERLKRERGQLRTDVGECRAMLCQLQLEILERDKSLRSAPKPLEIQGE